MKYAVEVFLDLEWEIETKAFRCASWFIPDKKGGKLYGTHSFRVFKDFIESLPCKATLGGFNILSNSDLRRCIEWGIRMPLDFRVHDSFISTKLLHPTYPWKDLKTISRLHGFQYEDAHDERDPDKLLDYCGKDTYAAYTIYAADSSLASSCGMANALNVYQEIAKVFMLMEVAGMKVDRQFLQREERRLTTELGNMVPRLPDPELVTNTNALRRWVEARWNERELTILPRGEDANGERNGERSMNADYLELLPRQTKQFKNILKARATYSYYNLYVRRPLQEFGEFFHPGYILLYATTQRRSTRPAIQNWPADSRRAFRSRYSKGKILSVDFRNLEARLFAWQAGCTRLLSALLEGGYPLIASQTFGGPLIEKSDPKYKVIKATVLAVMYNMTPWLYGHNMWVSSKGEIKMSQQETEDTLGAFFKAYPEMLVERDRRKAVAWETGYAVSSVGVPIELAIYPEDILREDQKWQKRYRKRTENQAVNYPTQQLAGYVTACALVDVIDSLVDMYWGSFSELLTYAQASCVNPEQHQVVLPVGEIHDELVFDCPGELVDSTKEILKEYLVNRQTTLKQLCPTFDCPLDVEMLVEDYWTKD